MKLYYSPGACSLSVHIATREAGLAVDLVKVDLASHRTEDGTDYYTINPKGYVPCLALPDGSVLTEVAALLQYVAEQEPETKLAPAAGTMDRTRLQEWLGFVSSEIHKGFSPLWNPATPDTVKDATKKKLAQRFAYLDSILADRPFLMGSGFTVADAYLFTIMSWAKHLAVDLAPYEHLRGFLDRVAARPKVREALVAEGLLKSA